MSVPLGFKSIVDFNGQMWLLEGKKASQIKSLKEVSGPKVVLTDFGQALTGIEMVTASKNYAPAIIEKQLRDRGDMEGASQVFILDSKKQAGALSVFFAALPIAEYSKYLESAKGESDHCLYVPIWKTLLRCTKSRAGGVVFQHGDILELLVIQNKVAIHSVKISSSSYSGPDWESALNYLASELNQIEAEQSLKIESIQWYDWCADESRVFLINDFESLTGREVDRPKLQNIQVNQVETESGILNLLEKVSTADALKTDSGTYLFQFEKVLPWVAGLALAVSAGAFLAGLNWQTSAQDYKESTQNLLTSTQFEQKLADAQSLLKKGEASELQSQEVDFVDAMYQLAHLPSIPQMIGDLQASVSPAIHVTSLKVDATNDELYGGMIIEGHVDQDLDYATNQIEVLITKLLAKGYTVDDKGFIAKSGNNGFQIVLIPADRAGNKE